MALGFGTTVAAAAKVVLSVDDKALRHGLDQSDRRFKRSVDDMDRHSKRAHHSLGLLGTGAKLAMAGIASGVGLAAFALEKSVKAASTAEVAQARLGQAFKTAGIDIHKYGGVIAEAEARSRKLGFAASETGDALGSLMVATHDVGKSVKDLAIAEDLARFKHVDLAAATKMLTMASAGNARAIKQLGILLVPLTDHVDALKNAHVKATTAAGRLEYAHAKLQDKMETAAHAVDLVRQKVEGQGKAFASTAQGSMQVFHEQLQHIEVLIGTAVLPVLTQLLDKVNEWMDALSRSKRFHQDLQRGILIVKSAFADLVPIIEGAWGALHKFGAGISSLRGTLGHDIFSGLILGIVGSAGALQAITKLRRAMLSLGALGIGGGPVALGFLALTITIGGLAAAFLHNRSAAKSVSDAYKNAANAARDLNSAEDNLAQSELDVRQAHLRQKQAVDQVYDSQRAYNAAVRQYGAHSHQATEASHTLTQAKLDLKQADLDAARAVKAHTRAAREHVATQKNVIDSVIEAAAKQRHYQSTLGAIQGTAHHAFATLHMGWAANTNDMQSNSEKADLFAQRMRIAAAAADKAGRGGIATAYRKAAALADSLDRIPSDTEIRFVVKTLTMSAADQHHHGFAGGGRVTMGSGRADDVPALLARDEFVVTPGGERILEAMTAPGVLDWLQGVQPRAFADGGRVGAVTKTIEFDRLYTPPAGGAVNMHGLVPQVLRALGFARGQGWGGSVTSGFRTHAEQAALYARYLAGGPLAAKPGTSSHEFGQAVDVTNYGSFGSIMSRAPGFERLYNRLGAADPVHFSVSGYAGGGRAGHHIDRIADSRVAWKQGLKRFVLQTDSGDVGIPTDRMERPFFRAHLGRGISRAVLNAIIPWWEREGYYEQLDSRRGSVQEFAAGGRAGKGKGKHHAPSLPESIRIAEARAAGTPGLGDDIVAVGRELTWVNEELASHDLTASERASMRVRRVRVVNRLKSLRRRQAQQKQRDYSQLPVGLQLAISRARLRLAEAVGAQQTTQARAALRAALWNAKHWLDRQLQKRLSPAQRMAVIDAITSIVEEIKGLTDDDGAGEGDGGTADLEAQLAQERERNAVLAETARLDEAFVATGIFGGGGGGSSPGARGPTGGGDGGTYVFNSLFPYTEEQARQAAAAVAQGVGSQPYRSSSVVRTAF